MDATLSKLTEGILAELRTLLWFVSQSRFAQKQGDPSIADFVFGNPHDMPPEGFTETLQRWLEPKSPDWFAYRPEEPAASAAAAAGLRTATGLPFEPEDVSVTSGAFGGLTVCIRALVDPGDEVIFLSPPWFFYGPMIKVAGGVPVRVTLEPPGWELDLDAIEAAITPRTRAIIVNSPHNPSGRIYQPDELRRLGEILRAASERNGRPIVLISDEAYRRILFDGNAFHSPAAAYEHTLVVYTYGKTLLGPGARLGYVAVNPSMPGREKMREALFLSRIIGGWQIPDALMLRALPDLEGITIDIPRLQHRRDAIVGGLRAQGYEVVEPASTFYIMVRSPISDDVKFCEMLTEHDVYVLPGSVFEVPGWFRMSVTARDEMIEKALPVFAETIERVRG